MRLDRYLQKSSNVFAENRFIKLAFMALLVLTVINTISLLSARNSLRTVIIPVGLAGTLEISHASASPEYLRTMARYIIHQIGDYTATSARPQFAEISTLAAPEKFTDISAQLTRLAQTVERYPTITSQVIWDGAQSLRADRDKIEVRATRLRYASGTQTRSDQVKYIIHYRIEEGRFYLTGIVEEPLKADATIPAENQP